MTEVSTNQIVFYETDDGQVRIEVRFENENLWLTQKLMAQLYECTTDNVSLHIKNVLSLENYRKKQLSRNPR